MDIRSAVSTLKSLKSILFHIFLELWITWNGKGEREKTRCDDCDDRVEAEEGDSSSALQAQDNPECPLCSGLWQILISFWCQYHPVDVHRGGCGTGSVTVAPFNGKTILETSYQYMVDLQGDAGAQLERCGLVWKPATVAAVVCCCHGWFGAAAVWAGREFSFQSPNDEWRLPVCDVSEMRVSTVTQSVLDCACFTTAGRSPVPVFSSGLPPAGSGWLSFSSHSLFWIFWFFVVVFFTWRFYWLNLLWPQTTSTLKRMWSLQPCSWSEVHPLHLRLSLLPICLHRGSGAASKARSGIWKQCWDYSRERSFFFQTYILSARQRQIMMDESKVCPLPQVFFVVRRRRTTTGSHWANWSVTKGHMKCPNSDTMPREGLRAFAFGIWPS